MNFHKKKFFKKKIIPKCTSNNKTYMTIKLCQSIHMQANRSTNLLQASVYANK